MTNTEHTAQTKACPNMFSLIATVHRSGARIGRVQYLTALSAAKLAEYRVRARYGAVRVVGSVVIDEQDLDRLDIFGVHGVQYR